MARRRKRKQRNRKPARSNVESHRHANTGKRDFTALKLSLVAMALLWLSMPGRDVASLAWISFAPLAWLIQVRTCPHKVYRQVWFASLLYWLITLHFVRLPHVALWLGWLALSSYLSVYLPLFVWVSRTLVHRFRVPVVVSAPVVFTGLEWIRVNFLTGFGIACVSHSQFRVASGIQVAEFFGAYGLTFAIVMVGSAVAMIAGFSRKPETFPGSIASRVSHAVVAAVTLGVVFGFGSWKLASDAKARNSVGAYRPLKVALIQTSIDTILESLTPEQMQQKTEFEFATHRDLTHAARLKEQNLDLVVWPESGLDYWDFLSDPELETPFEEIHEQQFLAWKVAIGVPAPFTDSVAMITGTTTVDPDNSTVFNSAIQFGPHGDVQARYFKNHLVMFGEYFPLVRMIPFVKEYVQAFRSLDSGIEFERMKVLDFALAPSICFETTVPHLIRRQLNVLEQPDSTIDVIVNVTNDGWFFGTSCLDLHLACNTFRAVEMRRPVLVAANTGFSAHIDEFGQHVKLGPRREEATLICEVQKPESVTTIYRTWGAWVACAMGCFTLVIAVIGFFGSRNADVPQRISQN